MNYSGFICSFITSDGKIRPLLIVAHDQFLNVVHGFIFLALPYDLKTMELYKSNSPIIGMSGAHYQSIEYIDGSPSVLALNMYPNTWHVKPTQIEQMGGN
jgi:hypothetical protein